MPGKEFPGGALNVAGLQHVPVEWHDHVSTPVAVQSFDFDGLDSVEDQARELLLETRNGERGTGNGDPNSALRAPRSAFLQWLEHREREAVRKARAEGFKDCLAHLMKSDHPKRRIRTMAFAFGMHLCMGWSGPAIAKQFGIRKQAFFQDVDRFLRELGVVIVRLNQRDEAAREKMRRRNFRPGAGQQASRPAGGKEATA